MYQEKENEAEFPKMHLAFGGRLRSDNRWVILSDLIPWDEVEKKYASRMSRKKGRKAYSVRVALGACIIKEKLGISDEETVQQIRENHYLQYFIGYESYRDERPFDPSLMVSFRKRLSAEVIQELNDLIIERELAKKRTEAKDTDDTEYPPDSGSGTIGNKGTLILDATCAPEAMRFPHDVTTLDEARQKTERIIDILHATMPLGSKKPRTYRRKARKEFLTFIRNRKPRIGDIRKALRKQRQYVERNIRSINKMADIVGLGNLTRKQYQDLQVIRDYVDQQKELYQRGELAGGNRILSITKPYVRAIARGKARGMFEFGAKISVTLFEKFSRVERLSWNNYNEGIDLIEHLETHKQRYGSYPEVVCADKIYRNRANLEFCKTNGIRLSGPKLGRPYKEDNAKRKQQKIERQDESVRVAIEGKFGEAKTRYSLDRIERRLKETSESAIMMVFFLANLATIIRARLRGLFVLVWNIFRLRISIILGSLFPAGNMKTYVQAVFQ